MNIPPTEPKLALTEITASGIGRPVSAARARPSMIVAGWRASVTSFVGVSIRGLEVESLLCETGVADEQDDGEAAADAGEREPTLGVALDGLRPGAELAWRKRPDVAETGVEAVEVSAAGQGRDAEHAIETDFDSRGRLTAQIDQPAANELLGPEVHLERGLLRHPGARASIRSRSQGLRRRPGRTRRGNEPKRHRAASMRKRPSPSVVAWPSNTKASFSTSVPADGVRDTPITSIGTLAAGLPGRIEHTAGHRHPARRRWVGRVPGEGCSARRAAMSAQRGVHAVLSPSRAGDSM